MLTEISLIKLEILFEILFESLLIYLLKAFSIHKKIIFFMFNSINKEEKLETIFVAIILYIKLHNLFIEVIFNYSIFISFILILVFSFKFKSIKFSLFSSLSSNKLLSSFLIRGFFFLILKIYFALILIISS